jgi:hypothetical protein
VHAAAATGISGVTVSLAVTQASTALGCSGCASDSNWQCQTTISQPGTLQLSTTISSEIDYYTGTTTTTTTTTR